MHIFTNLFIDEPLLDVTEQRIPQKAAKIKGITDGTNSKRIYLTNGMQDAFPAEVKCHSRCIRGKGNETVNVASKYILNI